MEHYTPGDLLQTLQAKLAQQPPGMLSAQSWAALDEFHVRGARATRSLAELLQPEAGWWVLDLGCGLGGAARHLAREHGCQVCGVDLTAEYCQVGQWLNQQLGLSEQVTLYQADALRVPFVDGAFDVVWSQHTAMNIPDKRGFYAEARRVLRPGGYLAIYDVLAGSQGEPHYPVPWARDASQSFLLSADAQAAHLREVGFSASHWRDVSAEGLAWFERQVNRTPETAPPLGLQLLLGEDFPQMIRNLRQNLAEGRVILLEVVARAI